MSLFSSLFRSLIAFLSFNLISRQQSSFPFPRSNGYAFQFRSNFNSISFFSDFLISDPIYIYTFFSPITTTLLLFLSVSPFLTPIKVSGYLWKLTVTLACVFCFVFMLFFFSPTVVFIYYYRGCFCFGFLEISYLNVIEFDGSIICVFIWMNKLIDGSKVKV